MILILSIPYCQHTSKCYFQMTTSSNIGSMPSSISNGIRTSSKHPSLLTIACTTTLTRPALGIFLPPITTNLIRADTTTTHISMLTNISIPHSQPASPTHGQYYSYYPYYPYCLYGSGTHTQIQQTPNYGYNHASWSYS